MKITKEAAELYRIRNGMEWGDIALCINGETVDVLANSSFGHYAYFWGACGQSPKEFLIHIDMHYAMNKFTNGKMMIPDADKYEKEIKQMIIEARRNGRLDAEEARSAWWDLLGIVDEYHSGDILMNELVNSEWFSQVFGDYESLPRSQRVNPQCDGFWNEIWLPFVKELIEETAK